MTRMPQKQSSADLDDAAGEAPARVSTEQHHGVAAGRNEPGGAQRAGRRAAVGRRGDAAVVDDLRGRARCGVAGRCGAKERGRD